MTISSAATLLIKPQEPETIYWRVSHWMFSTGRWGNDVVVHGATQLGVELGRLAHTPGIGDITCERCDKYGESLS